MSAMRCSLFSLGCAFGFAPPAQQTILTALRALKIAQRRLRPEVRAKLLAISSAHTREDFLPPAWRFVFADAATNGKSRTVTVAAKTSSEHPQTLEAFGETRAETPAGEQIIPQAKLLIDSEKALEKIRVLSKLKGAHAAEFRLIQPKGNPEPLWTVQFFRADQSPLVKFQVGAKTGNVDPQV
jgi:hypothetical protein